MTGQEQKSEEIEEKKKEEKRKVYGYLQKFSEAQDGEALLIIVTTLGLHWLTLWMEKHLWNTNKQQKQFEWWILLLKGGVCLLRALNYLKIFVIFHDLGHYSFFSQRWCNDLFGYLQCMIFGVPLGVWQLKHNFHHQHSNDLNHVQDNQTAPLSLRQYLHLPYIFTCGLLLVTPFTYLLINIQDSFNHEPFCFLLFFIGYYIKAHLGSLYVDLLSILIAITFGMVLFHLQHTFPNATRSIHQDYFLNGIQGSSNLYIPAPLSWFTMGIQYHHVHHLNARIPGYRLGAAHHYALQQDPLVWQHVHHLTLADLFTQGGGLILYDQDTHQYLSLQQVKHKTKLFHQYN